MLSPEGNTINHDMVHGQWHFGGPFLWVLLGAKALVGYEAGAVEAAKLPSLDSIKGWS